jgi:cytoskeleton protein RodZ
MSRGAPPGWTEAMELPLTSARTSSAKPCTSSRQTRAGAASNPEGPGVEHLRFSFEGESWIEVRDGAGKIIYSGVSGAGSTRTVQGKPPFALVIGNARQVSLEYKGEKVDMTPHVRVSVARFALQ